MARRRTVVSLLLCATITVATAQQCGIGGLDFSSLTSDLPGVDPSAGQYFVHVCGPLAHQPSCSAVNANASTCQWTAAERYINGVWNEDKPPKWYYINGIDVTKGVYYTLAGQADCETPRSASIIFICGARLSNQVMVRASADYCQQSFIIITPLACVSPSISTSVSSSFPTACILAAVAAIALVFFHAYAARAPLPKMTDEQRREWMMGDEDAEGHTTGQGAMAVVGIDSTSPTSGGQTATYVPPSPSKTLSPGPAPLPVDPLVLAWARNIGTRHHWSTRVMSTVEGHLGGVTLVEMRQEHFDAARWRELGMPIKIAHLLSADARLLSSPPTGRLARRTPVCVESKSVRSQLKFLLVRRYLKFIVYRSLLVNCMLTLMVSIVLACFDAWTISDASKASSQCPLGVASCVVERYRIDYFAVLYSIGYLLIGAAFVLWCPKLAYRCRCVGSPLYSLISNSAFFLALMDQTSMQNLLFKIARNLQTEVSTCINLHQVPSAETRTIMDWHLYVTFTYAAVKLVLSIWTYAVVQRLAFMPLLESNVSARAVARLMHDHYNVRGAPLGLIPTHRCASARKPTSAHQSDPTQSPTQTEEGADGGTSQLEGLSQPMLLIPTASASSPLSPSSGLLTPRLSSSLSDEDSAAPARDGTHLVPTWGESLIFRSYDVDLVDGEVPLVPVFNWYVTAKFLCCRMRMAGFIVIVSLQSIVTIVQAIKVISLDAQLSEIFSRPENCSP